MGILYVIVFSDNHTLSNCSNFYINWCCCFSNKVQKNGSFSVNQKKKRKEKKIPFLEGRCEYFLIYYVVFLSLSLCVFFVMSQTQHNSLCNELLALYCSQSIGWYWVKPFKNVFTNFLVLLPLVREQVHMLLSVWMSGIIDIVLSEYVPYPPHPCLVLLKLSW